MSDLRTSDRGAEEQARRRAFLERIPENYCPSCTSILYDGEATCFVCNHEEPEGGWPPIGLAGDPWLGSVLAERYLITRQVATSRRARVYIADSRIIPRSFAIKIMNVTGGPNLDEAGLRKRLRREVEALGTLRNPHIVSFYDVFDARADHVAFVMDLVEGVTLTELVAGGPLPIVRALELTRQVANGLFESHARGLIHRDLKPSNVMIEKLPIGDDFVRILDFGVMWVRGTALGTGAFDTVPVYTSPEQVADEGFDHRTDLYSLGALLFFMLVGEPPFDPDSFADMGALGVEPAPTLAQAAGFEFPAIVEEFVASLLAADPDDRPADVGTVLEYLADIAHDLNPRSDASAEPATPDEEWAPSSSATAMGMVPTLGDAGSSAVLRLGRDDMSSVSEAAVTDQVLPELMSCRGEGYGFVQGDRVYWEGQFADQAPAELDPDLNHISFAISAELAILGTDDGRIVLARPGEDAVTAFQDPRQTPMNAVAIVAAGDAMIAGSDSGRLYMNRGTDFVRLGGGDQSISALCLSDKGEQFAVARGATIQILSVGASNLSTFPSPLNEAVVSMAFSPDAYLVAVLTVGGLVVLESAHTGQEFMRLETGDPTLGALTFSSDNHLMGLFLADDRVVLRVLT